MTLSASAKKQSLLSMMHTTLADKIESTEKDYITVLKILVFQHRLIIIRKQKNHMDDYCSWYNKSILHSSTKPYRPISLINFKSIFSDHMISRFISKRSLLFLCKKASFFEKHLK